MSILEKLSAQINSIQPNIIRDEDRDALPSGAYVPVLSDIIYPSIAMAFAMIILRHLFDRFIVVPFGEYFGIKDKTKKIQIFYNQQLEAQFERSKSLSQDDVLSLSKKTGLSERHIQVWFRKRKQIEKASDMKRLSDAGWSFVFYAILSWVGIFVLWDKPWFTSSIECWKGWPAQPVTNDIYWYYIIELGFYISYLYMLFTDHRRKDFYEFLVHHIVTVVLMVLSWSINVVRIGTLVLVIHDQVDYFLALAKTLVYIKKNLLADITFGIFLLVWIVTRLCVYPYVVLYSVYIDLPNYAENEPYIQIYDRSFIGQLLKALLVVLQILHILWSIVIAKSALKKVIGGKLSDTRSDTEDDSGDEKEDEDDDMNRNEEKVMNGNTKSLIKDDNNHSDHANGHLS